MEDLVRLTRQELRELDRLAIEEYGIPSSVLMENAGRGAAECVLELCRGSSPSSATRAGPAKALPSSALPASTLPSSTLPSSALPPSALPPSALPSHSSARVAIFCGSGNNGGDGGVVARHLANAGVQVEVFATDSLADLRGDAALQRRILEHMRIPVHDVSSLAALERASGALAAADILVDGLLGTGFTGEVRPKIARLIESINALRGGDSQGEDPRGGGLRGGPHGKRSATVVALDLPSGLDCDSGQPARPTVVADVTVTFVARKLGFDAPQARAVLGIVHVASIGAPVELIARVREARDRS